MTSPPHFPTGLNSSRSNLLKRKLVTLFGACSVILCTGCQSVPPGREWPLVSFLDPADLDAVPPAFVEETAAGANTGD